MSRTAKFKELLQSEYEGVLGQKLNLDVCWLLFKASIASVIKFTITDPEHKLPLNGVGTFAIQMQKPKMPPTQKSKMIEAMQEKLGVGVEVKLPYLKWKMSDGIRKTLIEIFLGKEVSEILRQKTGKSRLKIQEGSSNNQKLSVPKIESLESL